MRTVSSRSLSLISPVVALVALVGCSGAEPAALPVPTIEPERPMTTQDLQATLGENGQPDGLSVAWTRDGELVADVDGLTVPADLTAKGQRWRIAVRRVDSSDSTAQTTAETVIVNSPPTVELTLDVDQVTTRDDVTAQATTADDDEDFVDVRYVWHRDGTPTSLDQLTLPASETRRGEVWELQATPTDGDDLGLRQSVTVEVVNTPPSLASVAIQPDVARTTDTLTAHPSGVEDLDGDPVSLRYTWFVNGVAVPDVEGPELPSSAFVKGEVVAVQAVPDDGFEEGDAVVSGELVIQNTPPVATAARIEPGVLYTLTEASCVGVGFADVDDDPEGWRYAWRIDGEELETGEVLPSSSIVRGSVVQCVATPFDGDSDGEPVVSTAVTVRNTPPSVGSVSLSPEEPRVTDTIVAEIADPVDADEDPITYRYAWTVGGRVIDVDGAELSGDHFRKGQEVVLTVTPNDGFDDGEPVESDPVTAVNTPPVVTAVSLGPDPAYTTTGVSATVTASDADGDALSFSYTWFLNDEELEGSSSTLSHELFVKRDELYVEVTALDGDASSEVFTSESLVISNSAPSAPAELDLTPEVPFESEDLVCTIGTAGSDVDGDELTYEYEFTVDGERFGSYTSAALTYTLSADETAEYDEWSCRARTVDSDEATSGWSEPSPTRSVRPTWLGERQFSNCGQTGRSGPTTAMCESTYADTPLDGEVTVTSGIQYWTAPRTGTYRIEAWGAEGGTSYGGRGAFAAGTFELDEGDELKILVGQRGTNRGGGGGTFVTTTSNDPLVVAGGGGAGVGGSWTFSRGATSSNANHGSLYGRSLGNGGTAGGAGGANNCSGSGGAGGFYGTATGVDRGFSYVSGGLGGSNSYAPGGFGGGGANRGGGGGYSGGGSGGCGSGARVGGGGGSYVTGTAVSSSAGVRSGHGAAHIDLLD